MRSPILQQLGVLLLAVVAGPLWAASASSTSFRIQSSGLDTSGGLATSSSFAVGACLGAAVVGASTSSSFRLDAGCAAISNLASVAPAVHGVCASPAPSIFGPDSANQCTVGTPSAVSSGANGWAWSCSGSNGGTTASCSSAYAGTFTGSGNGWASLSGTAGWVVDATQTGFIAASGYGALPAGYQFPHGLFKVRLTSGPSGSATTVTLTFPSPLPTGTVYWKYGPTLSNLTPHWYIYPGAVISGSTVTLSLTDGADGDTDLLANSVISDPGGPGVPDAAQNPIPTLSEWMLLALITLMASLTWLTLPNHQQNPRRSPPRG